MLDDLLNGIADRKHYDHSRLEHRHDGYRDDRYGHYHPLLEMAPRLLRNKVILAGMVIFVLLVGAVGIWLTVALLPYFGQVISMAGKLLEQQGIKGILETITPLLQKIWEGAGK